MALSDNEVSQELKKMVAFINQEALEKAREIQIKADEEFAAEKSKLVRQEISQIDALYERKYKQAELADQITRSNVKNKTRLKILSAQQELLDDIFDQARKRLEGVSKDEGRYEGILKGLILEALYSLNESSVSVKARYNDHGLVAKAILGAEAVYHDSLGEEVKIDIDENDALPDDSAGGVFVAGFNGKIDVNNTLEERLLHMEQESLPAVRMALFGPSPNRKFFD